MGAPENGLQAAGNPAKPKSHTDRTVDGLFWVLSGSGMQTLLKAGVLIVMARLITPAEFGVVSAALVVVAFAQLFSRVGVAQAVVQRNELTEEHQSAGFGILLGTSILVGFLFYLSSGAVAAAFRMEELADVVSLLSVVFPLTGFGLLSEALLQREMQFKRLALMEVLSYAIGYGVIGIALGSVGLGLWALVWAQIGQTFCMTVILILGKRFRLKPCLRIQPYKELLTFGGWFSLGQLANFGAYQIDNMVVARWLGAEALGIYGRAFQVLTMPTKLVGRSMLQVLFPALASIQDEPARIVRAQEKATGVVVMVGFPLSAILFVLAPEIVKIMLGPRWDAVVVPFQILALAIAFRIGHKTCQAVIQAKGAVHQLAWRQWTYVFAVFIGAWTGRKWGLEGVSIGVLAAITVNYFLMLNLASRLSGLGLRDIVNSHFRHLIISVMVGGAGWLLASELRFHSLHPVVIAVAIFVFFGITFWVIGKYFGKLLGLEGAFMIRQIRKRIGLA